MGGSCSFDSQAAHRGSIILLGACVGLCMCRFRGMLTCSSSAAHSASAVFVVMCVAGGVFFRRMNGARHDGGAVFLATFFFSHSANAVFVVMCCTASENSDTHH